MGAIVNGAAVHGGIVKPYGSTFLMFSDYMRGGVRLSALMGTAGRVGLDARLGRPRRGRADAPAGRALRGAARDPQPLGRPPGRRERDGRARGRSRSSARTGRSRCSLSRQNMPTLDRGEVGAADGLERGAYVLWDPAEAAPELMLIAPAPRSGSRSRPRSGSPPTASTCASSRCRAGSCSRRSRAEYRDEVLPPEVTARLAVEAGRRARLEEVGRRPRRLRLGLDRFGASAPGNDVLERLGFTVDNIVARAQALLERVS